MERIVAQISPEDLKLDAEQFTHMLTCWEVRWLSLDVFFLLSPSIISIIAFFSSSIYRATQIKFAKREHQKN